MKLIFLTDLLSQPRCIKRVSTIADAGYTCEVYGFDRNRYNCNTYPASIPVTVIGQVKDKSGYLSKFKICWRAVRKMIRENKGEKVLFYAFGFLSALCFRLNRVPYVYEISDILYAYPRFRKVLKLLRWFDLRLIHGAEFTLMTSEGFAEFFGIQPDAIILQPNKVNRGLLGVERSPITLRQDEGLVFAFVGAVRYKTIFDFAEEIGASFPGHAFHFYGQASGSALAQVMELTEKYANVRYFGPFRNPEDLEQIYRNVDVVVACYNTVSLNERLAEPNKLYESLLFCKPIVVSDGIFLSRRVRELDCGYTLAAGSREEIHEFIRQLDPGDLVRISQKERAIDASALVDDAGALLNGINRFFNNERLPI